MVFICSYLEDVEQTKMMDHYNLIPDAGFKYFLPSFLLGEKVQFD